MAATTSTPTLKTPADENSRFSEVLAAIYPGEHLIAGFTGKSDGPTLIVVGGLHGNEAAGAVALLNVSQKLQASNPRLNGRVYFIAGNTRALGKGVRFIDRDLNRSWTAKNLSSAVSKEFRRTSEGKELKELDELLDGILITAKDEVFVLDLHSTSADGSPFATVGDTLRNRRFAQKLPITIILGIEEQLDGTMLEYLNNAGAVTLGFEGGQHYSGATVTNHEAIVWGALVNSGVLAQTDQPLGTSETSGLRSKRGRIFEIRYRHAIGPDDGFEMMPGFDNFDPVRADQPLATDRHGIVTAPESGLIFMPLYQKLGEDGFFIGRRVASFWLSLSELLREIGIQKLMPLLPGVMLDPDDPESLIVDTNVARLFPLQVFHLLGFRRRRWVGDKLIVSRRRHDSISPFRKK